MDGQCRHGDEASAGEQEQSAGPQVVPPGAFDAKDLVVRWRRSRRGAVHAAVRTLLGRPGRRRVLLVRHSSCPDSRPMKAMLSKTYSLLVVMVDGTLLPMMQWPVPEEIAMHLPSRSSAHRWGRRGAISRGHLPSDWTSPLSYPALHLHGKMADWGRLSRLQPTGSRCATFVRFAMCIGAPSVASKAQALLTGRL